MEGQNDLSIVQFICTNTIKLVLIIVFKIIVLMTNIFITTYLLLKTYKGNIATVQLVNSEGSKFRALSEFA